jgi:ribonuclease D
MVLVNKNSMRCFTAAPQQHQPNMMLTATAAAEDDQHEPAAPVWISKEYIQSLPLRQWDGPIQLLHTKDEMETAIRDIIVQSKNVDDPDTTALGFDIEIKPTFQKGQCIEPPALLQIATADTVYLFRLCALRGRDGDHDWDRTNSRTRIVLPSDHDDDDDQGDTYAFLLPLLTDSRIIKAGVGVAYDLSNLQRLLPFLPAGFCDLVEDCPITKQSVHNPNLQALAAHFLHCHVPKSKSVNLSNWAKKSLTDSQIKYAANDAWLGRAIWQAIQELQQQKE